MKTFREKVLSIVSKIPKGKTLTYGAVAKKAGNPKASRAVGAIVATNYNTAIPCHRVLGKNGTLTGYNRGIEKKKALLKKEGVFVYDRVIR